MLKRRKTNKSDRKYWIDKLDQVFSLYIRMRDSKAYHFQKFRCISCGDVKDFEQMDCGHFVSRNAMVIRWNTDNCNGECRKCNRLQGDHLLNYRKNLIIKLGQDSIKNSVLAQALPDNKKMALIKKLGTQRVEWLEAQKYEQKKWSVEELQQEYMYYAALVLELKNSL